MKLSDQTARLRAYDLIALLVITMALLLTLSTCATGSTGAVQPEQSSFTAPVSPAGSSADGDHADGDHADLYNLQTSFRSIAGTVLPSVVRVDVQERVTGENQLPFFGFDFFFGNPDEEDNRDFEQQGTGSGVVVRRDGDRYYVVTNNHVVAAAESITVILDDGTNYEAVLEGADGRRDLAVVSFTAERDIPVAVFGDSDSLRVGDWVVAIGSPFGFQNTVTAGIVSALGRQGGPQGNISDFIQTDAAINQGNSGGALVNLEGELVGINTWITSATGGSIGLGFAIPINNATRVIDDFVQYGEVQDGWLGVSVNSVTDEVASALQLQTTRGAMVHGVFIGSPAHEAGLLPGDFITAIADRPIRNSDDLVLVVGDQRVGTDVEFAILRNGQQRSLTVRIGLREAEETVRQLYRRLWPGMAVYPITPEVRAEITIDTEDGVIAEVDAGMRGTPAELAGLRTYDIITTVNGEPVTDLHAFYEAINTGGTATFEIELIRDGQPLIVSLARPERTTGE